MKPDTETFLKVLEPEDTSTGGGSASAITGAGALLSMCCLLSSNMPDENGGSFRETAALAQELSNQLLMGGKEDTQAFQSVRSAYKLPKETEADRGIRLQAIQDAWFDAARIPLHNVAHCLQVVRLATNLAGQINPKVRSDLNCAILLARAGALGCLENVATNLPSLKDPAVVSQLAQQSDNLRAQLASLEINDRPSNLTFPK
jgi:formiminotetrahydrofolate cyclodeaminase